MERDKRTKAKEEYVVVLDFLKNGYSNDSRPFHMKEPIIQCIGKEYFYLLELVAKPNVSINPHEEIYIGDGERDKVAYIKGSLQMDKLTQTSKNELRFVIEKIIENNEEKFINFFNNSGPISLRSHQLEILPGIGKKHAKELLNEREIELFKSFEDIKSRVSSVPSPKKAVIERIMIELEGQDRFKLFVRG
jgi:putative nucleotide binding protein